MARTPARASSEEPSSFPVGRQVGFAVANPTLAGFRARTPGTVALAGVAVRPLRAREEMRTFLLWYWAGPLECKRRQKVHSPQRPSVALGTRGRNDALWPSFVPWNFVPISSASPIG
jgi:hypothetical protein